MDPIAHDRFKSAWLIISYNCNNDCIWCYAKNASHRNSEPNLKKILNLLQFFSGLYVTRLTILGGEPTLCSNLKRIIEKAAELGMSPNIVTNGRRLSNPYYLNTLINAGISEINISIQSSSPSIHDSITQVGGSLNETVKGIENSLKLCGEENISTVITAGSKNQNSLLDTAVFLNSIGVRNILFNACLPEIESPQECESFCIKPRDLTSIFKKLYLDTKKLGIPISFYMTVPLCLFEKEFMVEAISEGAFFFGCHVFYGAGLVVDNKGNLLPCTHWVNSPYINLFDNPDLLKSSKKFLKYWNTDRPHTIRSELQNYRMEGCSFCSLWAKKCIGGCPLLWLLYDQNKYIPYNNDK